ncbi:sensor domain-containing diguanylate cyclase [Nocardia carnea]|uniref:sensor domain-containing diguanylate cyclase n=1 Tax=Nocardia carnea TaxID=37328 RepID=UPI0024553DA9|nr:sensor domain-containing diguanylate cyclase [Nocardia carnea]
MLANPAQSVARLGLSAAMVERLMAAMYAETLDPSVGALLGARLAESGRTSSEIYSLAEGLLPLAELCDHPEAHRRLACLLVALGQGYQRRREDPHSPTEAADERFRMIFDHSGIAIAIGDTRGQLLDVNQALAEMIGVPIESLRGISVYDFAPPEDRVEIRTRVFEGLVPARSGTVRLERGLLRADGSRRRIAFTITFVDSETAGSDYLLAVGEDVTDRYELQVQAHHDPLTGLPNRRHLRSELGRIIDGPAPENNTRLGLCFVDLDYFKRINDEYGHIAGDRILIEVARRLRFHADRIGCSVSRIGGDEFVVLIPPPVTEPHLIAFAEGLCTALETPVSIPGADVPVSASIGIVSASPQTASIETVLDAADAALRKAKSKGRRRWVLAERSGIPCHGDPAPASGPWRVVPGHTPTDEHSQPSVIQ